MSAPFYLLQAQRGSRIPELEVGTFLAAQMIGSVVLNPLWGWWGDRRGKLSLLKVLTGISAVSPLLAIVLPLAAVPESMSLAGYALIFFFVGTAMTGDVGGELGYLMEISPGRPASGIQRIHERARGAESAPAVRRRRHRRALVLSTAFRPRGGRRARPAGGAGATGASPEG